jgi:uncharacterized protein
MASPSFVVRASDLEDGPKQVSYVLGEEWLREALADTGAEPRGPGRFSAELMKNGREVIVRGNAHVEVTVPCVVTLEPLPFELDPEVFLLLRPEPGSPDRKKRPGAPEAEKRPPKAKKRKEEEPELTDEDAASDTYNGEEIVLDGFLREFVVLEIPPYPRRSDLPSPPESISSRPLAGASAERPIDPRLAPLAGIAQKLRREGIKE